MYRVGIRIQTIRKRYRSESPSSYGVHAPPCRMIGDTARMELWPARSTGAIPPEEEGGFDKRSMAKVYSGSVSGKCKVTGSASASGDTSVSSPDTT